MPKRSKPKKPVRSPQAGQSAVPPEIREALKGIRAMVEECPEGWAIIAEALRDTPDVEPDVLLGFLAREMGKEALPLLRGLAVDDDEELALGALKALPLLGTRAAGEILAEAFHAYPEGERAKAAWQGVEALKAQGINVTVPEPAGARVIVPKYRVRETWETWPDGVGNRETVARLQDRYGVWHALMVLWNDQAGVKDGLLQPFSRADWEELVNDELSNTVFTQVPLEYVQWSIARARELNGVTGFPLDEHLAEWDEYVGAPPAEYAPPDPLEAVRSLPPDQLTELRQALPDVLQGEGFGAWAVEPADVRPWFEEWQKIAEEEPEDQDELLAKLDGLGQRVAAEIVTPEMVTLFRHRLVDIARKCAWDDTAEDGEVLSAAALDLDTNPDAHSSPLFRELVINSMEMLDLMVEDGVDPEAERFDPMQPVPRDEEEEDG